MILKKQNKMILAGCTAVLLLGLTACSSEGADSSAQPAASGGGGGENRENLTQTVGLVTEVLGNEISMQVGEGDFGPGGMGGEGGPGGGSMPEGEERPEGAGPPEGTSMPEGGERPEGEGPPEGMEMPEGASMPEGGGRPEGAGGGGGAQMEDQDYSEIITLTDETRSYTVPVDTPVMQFGTEMTFSQITADMYITVSTDENDQVVSINILG